MSLWWWGNDEPACNLMDGACTIGDIDFESVGKIYWPDSSYFTIDQFDDESFMLVSEREYLWGQSGTLGIVTSLKEGVANDDVSNLVTIPLDPSPYEW